MQEFYLTNELVGKGLPILLKNGAIAKQRLIDYISRLLLKKNYTPLATPHIGNVELFITSGHYPFYKESMYPLIEDVEKVGSTAVVRAAYALKPMNCPFHIKAYDIKGIVSYKELPVKFYEFGQVYRHEDSGALSGLFRVRSFTQDDGHIFCSMEQVDEVVYECIELVKHICSVFGLKVSVKLSKRGDNQEKYIGNPKDWDKSEDILKAACFNNFGNDFKVDVGGAAFYGPKIDFIATDKLNREWQLGTIQLDFNLPERFDINYITDKNKSERPVLIHRALLGSLERFLGILLENDLLPLYLQPFNMGVIWLGEDVGYFADFVKSLWNLEIYPTIITSPKNLREAMSQLYAKGITNISIIGRIEERNKTVNFNKKDMALTEFLSWASQNYKW